MLKSSSRNVIFAHLIRYLTQIPVTSLFARLLTPGEITSVIHSIELACVGYDTLKLRI